jgi:8-hydroxy-5-deazaflavin:NADPH oxidoreductase
MNFGILGSGMVGQAIATKLVSLGHEVKMGSRTANSQAGGAWVKSAGARASQGTFAQAAAFGEIIFSCTKGDAALDALRAAGVENMKGKIVVDVSNPLDPSHGMPPPLIAELANTNSLGEEVQKLLPGAFVVKTLNTTNCEVMVNPSLAKGDSDLFICGNDAKAKAAVAGILRSFGWKDPIDLGDITGARGMEMILPIWMRLWGIFGTPHFNFKVMRG